MDNTFGSSRFGSSPPLCSNVVLLVRTTSCCLILLPGKTSHKASQGMDGSGHSQWMGPSSPWTSTEVGEVANDFIRSQATDRQPAGATSRSLATARPSEQRARPRSRRSSGTCTFESIEFGGCLDSHGQPSKPGVSRTAIESPVGPDRCVRREVASAHQEVGGGTICRGRAPQCRMRGSCESSAHQPRRRNCTAEGQGGPAGGSCESCAKVFSGGRSGKDEGRKTQSRVHRRQVCRTTSKHCASGSIQKCWSCGML